MRCVIASFLVIAAITGTSAGQDSPNPHKNGQATLKWLGTAGWEISDGATVILIDPYISRILGPQPPGRPPYKQLPGDTRTLYGWEDIPVPDVAAIDTRVPKADYVLVTHTHYDHDLDVPHIALKTNATVIGTESTSNVMRAYSVPEAQLISVHGGEDYDFGAFSLKVIPSIHSPLDHKHYFSSSVAPEGMNPTHWDNFAALFDVPQKESIDALQSFVQEIKAASPKTEIIVPRYFEFIALEDPAK